MKLALNAGLTQPIGVSKDFKVDETAWPPKFFKCVICTSDGDEVAFTNTRRFGRILAVDNQLFAAPRFAKLGPDPFVEMPPVEVRTAKAFIRKCVHSTLVNERPDGTCISHTHSSTC